MFARQRSRDALAKVIVATMSAPEQEIDQAAIDEWNEEQEVPDEEVISSKEDPGSKYAQS